MLLQPLLDQLTALGLHGCRAALEAQQQHSQYAELTFEDRLGLLLEVECTRRSDKRLQRRVKNAHCPCPWPSGPGWAGVWHCPLPSKT